MILFVCYHGDVCERERELLLVSTALHKASLAGNKLPHGLETARGNHVEFKCKEEDFSVMSRHPQRGCVDGQYATASWQLDQTKHTCNLAGVAAWEGHAEIPSYDSVAHMWDLLYLCWSFSYSLLDAYMERMHA